MKTFWKSLASRRAAPSFKGATFLCSLLCTLAACQQDTLLLVSVIGPAMQTLSAALTIGGKRLDPVQQLRGSETKFALSIPKGQSGTGELRVEGFQGNACVAARGSIPFTIADGEQLEVAVPVGALAAHECPVDAATLVDLHGFSDNDVWAVGDYDSVVRWDGQRWNRMPSAPVGFVSRIWGDGPNAVLLSGSSLQSYDGKKFEPMMDPTTSAFYAVGGVPGSIWAAGDLGTILRYENGMWKEKDGSNQPWSPIPDGEKNRDPSEKTPILREIAVTGDGNLWISGDNGNLLRWDAGNGKWVRIPLDAKGETLRSISVKGNDAWLASTKGSLWRLISGNWVRQAVTPAPVNVYALLAQDSQTLWLSGARGVLMKCTPMDNKTVTCTDRRFTTTNLLALWGGGQGDLWAAGGVYLGDGKGRENNIGSIYHLLP